MEDKIENILIIRRGAIGDIIFTLPAYYMLRSNFPNSKISFLVKDVYSHLLAGFPGLDEIITINNKVLSSRNILDVGKMSTDLFHTLRNNNYQLVVDFAGHGEQAFLLWLTGIKHRWGSINSNNPVRKWFYTNTVVRKLQDVHLIDQHLKLLEQGGLTLFPVRNQYSIPQEKIEKASALFTNLGLSRQKPTVFIQPFTGDGIPGKIWPLERYVRLAEYWQNKGVQVLFGGGSAERIKLNDLATRFPVAAGQADFLTSAGLTLFSSIVVGGDTGLLHAALAVGTRTVMAVGPTNPQMIGPYKHPEWAVRPKTGNRIENISVEEMIQATEKAMNDAITKQI